MARKKTEKLDEVTETSQPDIPLERTPEQIDKYIDDYIEFTKGITEFTRHTERILADLKKGILR